MTPVLALSFMLVVGAGSVGLTVGTTAPPSTLVSAPVPSPTVGPTATPSPAVVAAWLGVTLGESSKDVRAQLGRPRQIIPSSVGDLWRYDIDNGNVTLELVLNQDQVLQISARLKDGKQSVLSDPFGASLGMSSQTLQSTRGAPIATYDGGASLAYGDTSGVRWFYGLDNGVVTAIEVSKPMPPPPAAEVMSDPAHDGSTLSKAFLVKASTQTDSTNAEMRFLHQQPCSAGGNWQVAGEELVTAAGHFYDLFHVACSTTKLGRDFYFDVTGSYGK